MWNLVPSFPFLPISSLYLTTFPLCTFPVLRVPSLQLDGLNAVSSRPGKAQPTNIVHSGLKIMLSVIALLQ